MSQALGKTSKLVKRGVLSAIVVTGGGVIGLWCYVKNTLCIKQYKKYIELKGNDGPIEPSLKLINMVTEVNEELCSKEFASEYTNIDSILVPGLNTLHIGTIGTFQGGIVGLPSFFEFNKVEEVENEVMLNQTSIKSVEDVYDAFMLSDEARRYAIAREILLINSPQVYFDTVVPLLVPATILKLTSNPVLQIEISRSTLLTRIFFHLALTVIGLALWRLIYNRLKLRYEKKAEAKISKLGDDYIRGGIEYNTKAIERLANSASLKNQNSSIIKTVSDNLRSLFFVKELPLTYKVNFYKSLLEVKTNET